MLSQSSSQWVLCTLLTGVVVALALSFLQLQRPLGYIRTFVPHNVIVWRRKFVSKQIATVSLKTMNRLAYLLSSQFHVLGVYLADNSRNPDILFRSWLFHNAVNVTVNDTTTISVDAGDLLAVPVLWSVFIHCTAEASHNTFTMHQWTTHPFPRRFKCANAERSYILKQWSRCQKKVRWVH
jgi:hypothetical protein